jgi:glycosyltransferase involved in cell wall biosynthesis
MPLRIVIDVRHIQDFGIGTYIRNLVHALARVDKENQYILTATSKEAPEVANVGHNFEVALYEPPKRRFLGDFTYAWFLRGLAADLVHMPLNQVPLLMPKPYVVTIHDMSSFLFGGTASLLDNVRLYRFRRGLLRADRVIAVSVATRRDVEHVLGIPSEQIRQVYNAPDPKFFQKGSATNGTDATWERDSKQLLERYHIHYPFLLYAGRIRPHKNIPRLIEAFAVVRGELENHPKYSDLRLIIIGDELSKHPEVRRTVVQTRTQNVVRFLGFVPFDTLQVFYSAASAFVFPSLYEGFGLPPLEAMATGTPVVTSNVSSLPEVVDTAAMIVNPENVFDIARGIRDVLIDEELRERLITSGKERAAQFDWVTTAKHVLEVYRGVVMTDRP